MSRSLMDNGDTPAISEIGRLRWPAMTAFPGQFPRTGNQFACFSVRVSTEMNSAGGSGGAERVMVDGEA